MESTAQWCNVAVPSRQQQAECVWSCFVRPSSSTSIILTATARNKHVFVGSKETGSFVEQQLPVQALLLGLMMAYSSTRNVLSLRLSTENGDLKKHNDGNRRKETQQARGTYHDLFGPHGVIAVLSICGRRG